MLGEHEKFYKLFDGVITKGLKICLRVSSKERRRCLEGGVITKSKTCLGYHGPRTVPDVWGQGVIALQDVSLPKLRTSQLAQF